jgi:hypothetical protein
MIHLPANDPMLGLLDDNSLIETLLSNDVLAIASAFNGLSDCIICPCSCCMDLHVYASWLALT